MQLTHFSSSQCAVRPRAIMWSGRHYLRRGLRRSRPHDVERALPLATDRELGQILGSGACGGNKFDRKGRYALGRTSEAPTRVHLAGYTCRAAPCDRQITAPSPRHQYQQPPRPRATKDGDQGNLQCRIPAQPCKDREPVWATACVSLHLDASASRLNSGLTSCPAGP